MAVHLLAVDDSDGESWMEVLEGSPGPTVHNSRASSVFPLEEEATEYTHHPISADKDESWASDFEDSPDSKTDCNPGEWLYDVLWNTTFKSGLSLGSDAIASTANDEPGRTQGLKHSSVDSTSNQPLCLERPEAGDILSHYHEVENILKAQPEKAVYYRSWLCWMYRMQLSGIRDTVHYAPNYIIQVVNCLYGLQNHPFWRNSDKHLNQWYAMYRTCVDILCWWKSQRHLQNTDGDQVDGEMKESEDALSQHRAEHPSFGDTLVTANTTSSASPVDKGHHPCSAPYDPVINTQPNYCDCSYLPPLKLGDALNFLDKTFRSVDGRSLDEVGQRVTIFQTWVQWMHQAREQSTGCYPTSISTFPLADAVSDNDETINAYIKSIGLPPEATSYCHFVSRDS
jgi:hypothetical protein